MTAKVRSDAGVSDDDGAKKVVGDVVSTVANESATDEPARVTIRTALDTTMLVEAGAGSGKTTLMVDRLLSYIARGTSIEQLAAVTFTRKAATELRERLETRLEVESRSDGRTADERQHLQLALRERERMFIGTVHAFCARVLREYALDAGLPPDFTEMDEVATQEVREQTFRSIVEHAEREHPALLAPLQELGVEPARLVNAFAQFEQYRDVHFTAPQVPRPDHANTRDGLVALLEEGLLLRGNREFGARDRLQTTSDRLWRRFRTHELWSDAATFANDANLLLSASNLAMVQKRWGDTPAQKKVAKEYGERVRAFVDTDILPWFARWWAHAYPAVIAFLAAASDTALVNRRRMGHLGFDDLLTETARLLRDNATARRSIGERWRYLLVDEFQDTDPVQAEICFLLASPPEQGNDWRTVTLREGSLFVVGDPKQSIYRFRRADLAVYSMVQSRIAECGMVVRLTRNFRSVAAVGALVNAHFVNVFGDSLFDSAGDVASDEDSRVPGSTSQAAFAPFDAARTGGAHRESGVKRYWIGENGKTNKEDLVAEDAARLASWIFRRCAVVRDRRPEDFLILTANKAELTAYAHELALRNIAVSASGVASTVGGVLQELLIVVACLADPSNAVAVIAALEGWCVGSSHQELFDAREHGLAFSITAPPREAQSVVGAGLQQLHLWWMASQQLSAASLVERVMDDSGLFVLAASGDLGDRSAGQLLQLISVLRAAERTDLSAAMAAIELALSRDEDDPGLRPARTDAVRLMNLHKAKGLEANVVILAAPVDQKPREPTQATWRDETGVAQGALLVVDDRKRIVARPANWEEIAVAETTREAAEFARLLYVAVTRARDELVVSQRAPYVSNKVAKGDSSRWSPLASVLAEQAVELTLVADVPAGRRVMHAGADVIRADIAAAERRLLRAQQSHYTLVSVTEAAKRDAAMAESDGVPLHEEVADAADADAADADAVDSDASDASVVGAAGAKGVAVRTGAQPHLSTGLEAREFGSLVHAAIEGALRGRRGAHFFEFVQALVWRALPAADEDARSLVLERVLRVVAEAEANEVWPTLMQHGALAELNVARVSPAADGVGFELSEGVIDAAALAGNTWVVVDWKFNRRSDARSEATWARLLPAYQAQAEAYVDTLRRRTGDRGVAQIIRLQGNNSSG